MTSYKKDWEHNDNEEVIRPTYNDGYKRYDLSMKDVIEGINTSRYPINGGNVMVPDEDGNMKPLPDVIKPGADSKRYRLEMISSNGNIIKDRNFYTVLKPVLYMDNNDITEQIDAKYFKWTRVSGQTEADQKADAEWNLRWALGSKEVPISCEDVDRRAMFQVQYVTEAEEILWVTDVYKHYQKINNLEK